MLNINMMHVVKIYVSHIAIQVKTSTQVTHTKLLALQHVTST